MSLHDVYVCLSYIKELEPHDLQVWTDIVLRVTGYVNIADLKTKDAILLQDVAVKFRKQLQDDPFCEMAEEFESKRECDLAKKHYDKLDRQGVVVSRDRFERLSADFFVMKMHMVVMGSCMVVLCGYMVVICGSVVVICGSVVALYIVQGDAPYNLQVISSK